jgi:hypothetical protein
LLLYQRSQPSDLRLKWNFYSSTKIKLYVRIWKSVEKNSLAAGTKLICGPRQKVIRDSLTSFLPLFFSSNNTPGSTHSWVKAVSNTDSYLRIYSSAKIDSVFKKKVLSPTPRCATQCETQAKNFLVDSALCIIARSHLYLRILRIGNHMQK